MRPTEIPESDVYVCESTYDEIKKQIRKNIQGQGLRKFTHGQNVTPDEIYHFKTSITPIKVTFNIFTNFEHFQSHCDRKSFRIVIELLEKIFVRFLCVNR